MPKRKPIEDRLVNYSLFLKWLEVNKQELLRLAYRQFVKETGLTV